ncbi:hypothetical protein CRM22_005729 [Opisthorchis felineus]|uniref:Pericentrin/AKAP-450 centrosomal targeting domain-containing protein n=1 Tax=Opisthorchis felineus TaxID=147828 RepID=A0A4S2LPQ5_OPIFE|nr:hypothetical protein CRM22_005729 [Opisthorchis felineus]
MEVIYHDLASGRDSSLSQVLAAWNTRYEEQYAVLRSLFPVFGDANVEGVSDNAQLKTNLHDLTLSELREQFDEVLQLRATLMVEVDALQQIRAELEDSQCVSEVHIQLERATEENKRLQAAIRAAHEQISDLFFNKRVMEAEMVALRGDRDRQLAEANERVRMAEKAVVAMTSRIRGPKPEESAAGDKSSPASAGSAKPFVPFKPVVQRLSNAERTKSYATLTGMSFDEFDSLDEDDGDNEDAGQPIDDTPPRPGCPPVQHSEAIPVSMDSPPKKSSDDVVVFSDDAHGTSENDTKTFVLDEQPDVPPSPTLSSTPRKSLDLSETGSNRYIETPLLTEATSDWVTPIVKCREETSASAETVPKADYLKLLDDLEEVRLELDSVRREFAAKFEAAALQRRSLVDGYSTTRPTDQGLTEQLHDLAEKVNAVTPDQPQGGSGSLLPTTAPGATRMFDWSVSPDQTASSFEIQADSVKPEDDVKEETDREDRTPVRTSVATVCTSCLELQAELVTTEVLASTQLKEHTRISDAQIATLELELHNLRERLEQDQLRPFTLDSCVQTEPSVIDGGREHLAVPVTEISVPPFPLVRPEGVVRQTIDYQTEPPDSASTESDGRASVMLKRYSKLSADAACICLALAQRIASMNQRGVPDGEHSPDTNDDFNTLLNALSGEEQEDSDVDTDSYRSGYKILACSLARLNHEVERLASVVDTREYGRYGPAYENVPTANGGYSQDREHEVVELRTRLSAALQLLSERLPADTQKALIATSQIVESERIQLQAELERRMIMFEQSHTSSVAELESSRRALMEQLATAEAENVQLKDQLSVTQQKLQANDRFIAEQTEERESEREEFRTELARLETQLRKTKGELLAAKLVNGASVTTEDPVDSVSHNKSLWLEDSIEASEPKHQDSTHRPQSAPRHTMVSRLEQGNSLLGTFNCMCRRTSDVTHSRSWALSPRMTNNNGVFDFQSLSPDSVCTPTAAGGKLCHCTLGDVRSPTWPDDSGTIPTAMAHQESSDHTAVSLVAASSSFCQTEPEEESTENQEVVKTAVALLYLNDASSQTDVELVPLEELLQAQTRIRHLEENNVSLSPLLPNLDTHRRPSWVAEADDDSATGIDCVSRVFMDSSTQTLEAEIDENSPELVTKTKRIVRTRTWDAAAAAAFLGQLTLTEEEQEFVSSIVKRERRGTQGNSFSHQEPLQIELKDQAVNTETWDSPQPGSEPKPKRRHSLPSLLSTMDDTGVEMSRGMTLFDSVDLDLLRMSGVVENFQLQDVASSKSSCVPPHVDSIRSDLQTAEENRDTTLIHQVTEEESPRLASVTLLDRAQSPIEVLVDVQSPSIIAPSLSVTDASCDTRALEIEIIPASDLKALLEQKDASDLVLSAMREEITSLQTHHTDLQTDYNFLQEMLEERECELERFAQDSIALQTRLSAIERELKERKDVVLERDEDMFILTEANESLTARVRELEETLSKLSTRSFLETGVQPDEDLVGDRIKSPGPQMIEKEIDATRWNAVELYVQTDPDPFIESLITRVKELETALETSQSRVVESVEAGLQTDPDAVVENLTTKVKALEARRFEVIPSADVNVQTDTGAVLISEMGNCDVNQSDIKYAAEQSVQTDADQLVESLSARLKCMEEELNVRTRPYMVDCQIQTESVVATGDPLVSATAALPAPPNVVQVGEESDRWDTIVEETSTLHGFNDFGEAELAEVPQTEHVPPCVVPSGPVLATSTPDQLSEVTDAISSPVPQIQREDIPVELKTVVQRLRAESLRLFSLSTGFQPTDVSQIPTGNGEQPQEALQHQFSVFSDLVRANTSLKNALGQISQMVEVYEIPTSGSSPYQLTEQKTFSYEHIQRLVHCTANALAADETVWLGLLQLSFEQTAELVSAVSKPSEAECDGKVVPAQRLVWKAITRLGDQLSSFIRQEDQYRECLVQAHLVEQRYLSAELHTSVTRGDSLASEINRLTERLNTHKEALSRADSLNLRLVNQINNLKADLANANSDLQAEVIQSEQKQAKLDRLKYSMKTLCCCIQKTGKLKQLCGISTIHFATLNRIGCFDKRY